MGRSIKEIIGIEKVKVIRDVLKNLNNVGEEESIYVVDNSPSDLSDMVDLFISEGVRDFIIQDVSVCNNWVKFRYVPQVYFKTSLRGVEDAKHIFTAQ